MSVRTGRVDVAMLVLVAGLLAASVGSPGRASDADCLQPASGVIDRETGFTMVVACDGGQALRGPPRLLFGQKLNANESSELALQALPGIGPERAREIVRARERQGFRAPEDLLRVRGLGPVTLQKIQGSLEFGRETGDRVREDS